LQLKGEQKKRRSIAKYYYIAMPYSLMLFLFPTVKGKEWGDIIKGKIQLQVQLTRNMSLM
jgi:hypothetical protein